MKFEKLKISHPQFSIFNFRGTLACILLLLLIGCGQATPTVVVYTSQDQVYSEPIFQDFEKETGIQVRAVYDSEAVKTVGLVNRLLAEKNHPQCDVFWNNEELRTRQLEKAGVLRETTPWEAFGFRSRQFVVHTNQLNNPNLPRDFVSLTNAACRGKIALAYPLFGTTATHFLALREHWGEARWKQWCRALAANQPLLVDGNSVVVKMVAAGEAWIGLTDSDDILAGQREGLPVIALEIPDEPLAIRNTVSVIRGAPHPDAAQKLFDYLKCEAAFQKLHAAGAVQGDVAPEINALNWDNLIATQEAGMTTLKEIFLR